MEATHSRRARWTREIHRSDRTWRKKLGYKRTCKGRRAFQAKQAKKELEFKEDGQEYGQVKCMLGNGNCEVYCFDGTTRLCHIRGRMRGKEQAFIRLDDTVLVSLRDFQDEKGDIIVRYWRDEVAAIRLATEYRRLLMDDGRVSTKSEASTATFLTLLYVAATAMGLDNASRSYREDFTLEIRDLLEDLPLDPDLLICEASYWIPLYHVLVLKASLEATAEQFHVVWLNGEKFEFSAEAIHRAQALQRAWAELGMLLERWNQASEQPRVVVRPGLPELRNALVSLDSMWASFEHKYITELIEIEAKKELEFKEDGQEYGQVKCMLGNGNCEVYCFDGTTRLCHIRGRIPGSEAFMIGLGDTVLVSLRDSQDEKGDIIVRYRGAEAATIRLATEYRRLLMDDGRASTKSEASTATFLDGLYEAARAMGLDVASRSYREDFPKKYRERIWKAPNPLYCVGVLNSSLEATVEQYHVIWLNGEKFEFSAEAIGRAQALQQAWAELGMLLERWNQASEQPRVVVRPGMPELRNALVSLDSMWASFEHKYIIELIEIEAKARRPIVQAIEHDKSLRALEAQHGDCSVLEDFPEYLEQQKLLVSAIAHLNSLANFRGKGRDDLSADVLVAAMSALRRCDIAQAAGGSTEVLSAARILATDVVKSFQAMREYLRKVEQCVEAVATNFSLNVGLVARLVDWEQSWEVGKRYVQHEKLLDAVCSLVAEIRIAQRLVPALMTMCEECDVELFLVLARIVWLSFLANPWQLAELLKSLLPHRFLESEDKSREARLVWDSELEGFIQKFLTTRQVLVDAQAVAMMAGAERSRESLHRLAWEVLVKRAVLGRAGKEDACSYLSLGRREVAWESVEGLMHELERWSFELQLHCPRDWNQCSAILVHCLTGSAHKREQAPFNV